MFQKVKIPIFGLVQNMSYLEVNGKKEYIFGKDGVLNESKKLKIPLLGDLPLLSNIAKCSDDGKPAVIDSKSLATKEFQKITENLIASQKNNLSEEVEIRN